MGKIYIVEDAFTAKVGLAALYQKAGHEVVTGGPDMAAITAAKPGIIVTDIDVSLVDVKNANPMHFLEELKGNAALKGVEIFVYTDRIDVSLEVKLRKLKLSSYFTKDANTEFIVNSAKGVFNPVVEEEIREDQFIERMAPAAVHAAPPPTPTEVGQAEMDTDSFKKMFADFSDKVHEGLGENDSETLYNLGVSYMDMGLHDQALAEFERAAKSANFRMEALSMAGVCLRHLKRYKEAIERFKAGAQATQDPTEIMGFRYEIGVTLQEMGMLKEAFNFLGAVYKADKTYRDAADRLRAINASLKAAPQ